MIWWSNFEVRRKHPRSRTCLKFAPTDRPSGILLQPQISLMKPSLWVYYSINQKPLFQIFDLPTSHWIWTDSADSEEEFEILGWRLFPVVFIIFLCIGIWYLWIVWSVSIVLIYSWRILFWQIQKCSDIIENKHYQVLSSLYVGKEFYSLECIEFCLHFI